MGIVDSILSKFNIGKASDETQEPQLSPQEQYDQNKRLATNLTKEQETEKSWEFLYEISDKILNKASPDDQNVIKSIGQDLVKLGMQYQHVPKVLEHKKKPQTTNAINSNTVAK